MIGQSDGAGTGKRRFADSPFAREEQKPGGIPEEGGQTVFNHAIHSADLASIHPQHFEVSVSFSDFAPQHVSGSGERSAKDVLVRRSARRRIDWCGESFTFAPTSTARAISAVETPSLRASL